MLVGIFLSDVRREFAGNFTVWPGSHYLLENHFKARGTAALREGMPQIPLGEPVQLLCTPGDVVICHYQLAHTAAVNTSDNDRYAVFFRIWHRDLDRHVSKNYRENVWQHLTNIWTGWKIAP
jgi:ectoine hydroxylase-related dioxygenase (phytanoyl-CoA dioxygenase family)